MKKIVIIALMLLASVLSFSQSLVQLTKLDGSTMFYDISEIGFVKVSGGGSLVIFRGSARGIEFVESQASIQSNTCNSFMLLTASGAPTLVNKTQVSKVARNGTGSKLFMKDGYGDLNVAEDYATVAAQAAVPTGCGGSGGGSTNLTFTPALANGTVNSDTGGDAVIPGAVTSASNGAGGNAGLASNTDKYRIDNAVLAIDGGSDISVSYSTGTNPITKTANLSFSNVPGNTIRANGSSSSGPLGNMVMSPSTLAGRGSTGNVSPITLGSGLSMTGTVLSSTVTSVPVWSHKSCSTGTSCVSDSLTTVATGTVDTIKIGFTNDYGLHRWFINSTSGNVVVYPPQDAGTVIDSLGAFVLAPGKIAEFALSSVGVGTYNWVTVSEYPVNNSVINITQGTLVAASGSRTVPMNGQDLTFDNADDIRLEATGEYFIGSGSGDLPTLDSDNNGFDLGLGSSNEIVLHQRVADQVLSKAGAPVNGTDIAWYVGQLLVNTIDGSVYRATAKSTNPDFFGTGSTWSMLPTRATSGVTTFESRTGTVTSAAGDYAASEVTNVPAGTISGVTVQAAIDELATEKASIDSISTHRTDINNLQVLTGRVDGSTNMGTYTGTTILDNQSVKQNVQSLETAIEGVLPKDITTFGYNPLTRVVTLGKSDGGTITGVVSEIVFVTSAPSGTPASPVAIDTVGTDTMYVANNGAWVRFASGGGASVSAPTGQILYGTGASVASSANLFWNTGSGFLNISSATSRISIQPGSGNANKIILSDQDGNFGTSMSYGGSGLMYFNNVSSASGGYYLGSGSSGSSFGAGVAADTRLTVTGVNLLNTSYALKVRNSTPTDLMVVRNDGTVGIGTALPAEKLHVAGSIQWTGTLKPNGAAGTLGQVLASGGATGPDYWTSAGTGTIKGTVGATRIPYASGLDTLASSANFTYGSSRVTSNSSTGAGFRTGYDATRYADFGATSLGDAYIQTNLALGTGRRFGVNTTAPSATVHASNPNDNDADLLVLDHSSATMSDGHQIKSMFAFNGIPIGKIAAIKDGTGFNMNFYSGSSGAVNSSPAIAINNVSRVTLGSAVATSGINVNGGMAYSDVVLSTATTETLSTKTWTLVIPTANATRTIPSNFPQGSIIYITNASGSFTVTMAASGADSITGDLVVASGTTGMYFYYGSIWYRIKFQ